MSSEIDTVVLDFDGTLTDVAQESAGFASAVALMVARLIGSDRIDPLWAAALARAADPQDDGLSVAGKTVAPGDADPYVRARTAMQLVFDWLDYLRDPRAREAVQAIIFEDAYRNHTLAAPRPDAAEVLRALVKTGRTVAIVADPSVDALLPKLAKLEPSLSYVHEGKAKAGEVYVFGGARKHSLQGPTHTAVQFNALPKTVKVAGLSRPVYPKRGAYYDALCKLWRNPYTDAARTLVCGDVYELDLALPAALGCKVQLVGRGAATPRWARDHVAGLPVGRGQCHDALSAVLERL